VRVLLDPAAGQVVGAHRPLGEAEQLGLLATLAAKQAKNGFVFPGVGKLVVVKRKARMGRNPQTGESIKIPAKTVLKFRIAKAMKELALK